MSRGAMLVLLGLMLWTATGVAQPERLIRIDVTFQETMPLLPWKTRPPATRVGYGVLLDPYTILTTEHLVRNATHIEVRQARSGRRLSAQVRIADARVDLAMLQLQSLTPAPGLAMTSFGGIPDVGASLRIYQFDDTDDVQSGSATVNVRGVTGLPSAPYSVLTYRVLSELQVGGEGAPVFSGDTLVGLVISHNSAARIATVLGAPFLQRFVREAKDAAYRGFASAGFAWTQLVDPAKRAYLGVEAGELGILVANTYAGTDAARALRPLDVILRWDGHEVDQLGFYADKQLGRTEFSHLVKGLRAPGDTVNVELIRNRRMTNVVVTLTGDLDPFSRVPENVTGEPADYIVAGGFVIRELDGLYLRALGSNWRSHANPRLMHYYLKRNTLASAPDQRVVVVSGVLPDTINIGYHHFRDRVVTAINGQPVNNMSDVFKIADTDGPITRIRLKDVGVDITFDPTEVRAASLRLARHYGIPSMQSRRRREFATPAP